MTWIFAFWNNIKKVYGNDVVFLSIEITSSKACQNKVKFSSIEIMWKNLVETTWKTDLLM